MLQRGGDADLAEEPLAAEHRGEVGTEHLDRHLARVADVAREVDGGHASVPELTEEFVAAGEGVVQQADLVHEGSGRERGGRK